MKKQLLKNLFIIGLGNPGSEYEKTRHNAGRNAVSLFAKENDFPPFVVQKKLQALVSEYKLGDAHVTAMVPETFMNKSGSALKNLKLNKKHIPKSLVVVHDDLDLPIGNIKIVTNRGSAGHKGVESVIRAVGTQDFIRIRIGIAKPSHIKKSQTEDAVLKTVIGRVSPDDANLLKKGIKKAAAALRAIVESGVERAMNEWN
ncbi:MAG: peptidyl-tRNA hydrolase, PTH1 family [Parcubacteria group bacterium Gr01-1014_70]|nr:MAG: peptidyl-tRNA hydrolase, PTH1 family [Parcubacteria group bacterium Gr01-1014_70]